MCLPPQIPEKALGSREQYLFESIREKRQHWAVAGASTEVLKWINPGVTIPWIAGPPTPFYKGKSLSDLTPEQDRWWAEERERLVECGAWERGGKREFVTKAFLVPKGPGKWRLVVDLRHLNSFVVDKTTKFETLKGLRRLAKKGD